MQAKLRGCAMTDFRFFADYAITIHRMAILRSPSLLAEFRDQNDALFECFRQQI